MVPQDRHSLLHQGLKDSLVEDRAVHGGRVVAGQEAVTKNAEKRECLRLGHIADLISFRRTVRDEVSHEQGSHDDVHSLTVADLFIHPAVSCQDTPQPADAFLALKAGVFG